MLERIKAHYNHSFFWKLVSCFLLILLFAGFFVVGTGVYSYYVSRHRFLNQNQAQLDTLSSTVTMQIHMAYGHGITFFQEPASIMYFKPESRRSEEVRSEVWRLMELVRKSENVLSPLVVNEFIYFIEDQNVIAGAGTYGKEFFFSEICRFEGYDRLFWETHFSGPGRYVLPETTLLRKSGKIKVLPLVTVIKQFGSLAFHVCNISADYLDQVILSSNAFLDEYFISDGQQHLIMTNSGDSQWQDVMTAFASGKKKSNGSYIFKSEDEFSPWEFYCLLTSKNFFSVFRHTLWGSVLLMAVMVIGGIILIIRLSNSMYTPIRDVREILSGPESEQTDELDYIKEGVQHLMEKESWHQQREKTLRMDALRQSLVLLFNGIKPRGIEEMALMLQREFGFDRTGYLCATIMIDCGSVSPSAGKPVWLTFLKECLERQSGVLVVPLETHFFEVLFSAGQKPEAVTQAEKALLAIRSLKPDAWKEYHLAIGIGNPAATLETLSCAHKQAAMALPLSGGDSDFHLRAYRDLPVKKKVSFSFYDQKGILNNMETGKKELLESYLYTLIEKNEKQDLSSQLMAELYRQILFVGRRVLEDKDLTTQDAPRYAAIYRELAEDPDILILHALSAEVVNCLLTIQTLCFSSEALERNSRMDDIKGYIQQRYNEPLSLVSIAEDFNITPKYLSRIFKEETREKLSDYLAQIRMQEAKRLLANPHQKIGEIASLVGIDSRATFLRLFHKCEGLSPKEYRKLMHQN